MEYEHPIGSMITDGHTTKAFRPQQKADLPSLSESNAQEFAMNYSVCF